MKKSFLPARILLFLLIPVLSETQTIGNDAVSLYSQGREAQAQSNLLRAVELFRAALKQNPDYRLPLIGLAECFFLLEEYEEALQYVQLAQKYDQANLELLVLEGRIRIGLNEMDRSRALFAQVLDKEKNNLDARFGLAELDIAIGQKRAASLKYLDSLKIKPNSEQALLSLALLREAEGDREAAGKYLELALRYHSGNPKVQYSAGRFSLENGDYEIAEKRLQTALALSASFSDASLLLAQVYLLQGRPDLALKMIQGILEANRDNPLVWYVLGLAYERSGNTDQALSSLAQAIRLKPEDEIARIALENIALQKLPIKDPNRLKYAAYHLERGRLFEDRNVLDKALLEYRRSLRLDPESKEGRLAYAGVYRLMGFPEKYQKELEVLKNLGFKDPLIVDDIEIIRSQMYDSVAAEWGLDQYTVEKKKFPIAVFYLTGNNREIHPFAGAVLADFLNDQLRRFENLRLLEADALVESFEAAFRSARSMSSDYFLILRFEESERSFAATLEQYLSRTGKKIASYHAFRTGNDRIHEAFILLTSTFQSSLPLWGTLITRQFDRAILDLGRMDGIKEDDMLVVVRKGQVRLRNDQVGLAVKEDDIAGDFAVRRLDEKVTEGTLTKRSFFDLINPGDEVVSPAEKPAQPQEKPVAPGTGLLRRLYRLIGL